MSTLVSGLNTITTNGTYTVPAGTWNIAYTLIGGGGGGGGKINVYAGGGGGVVNI